MKTWIIRTIIATEKYDQPKDYQVLATDELTARRAVIHWAQEDNHHIKKILDCKPKPHTSTTDIS
jgi:hypothetical protein